MDDDEITDDFPDADLTIFRSRNIKAIQVAVRLAISASAPKGMGQALRDYQSLAIVVEVPASDWTEPVQDEIKDAIDGARRSLDQSVRQAAIGRAPRAHEVVFLTYDSAPPQSVREKDAHQVSAILSGGGTVIGISPQPRACLPKNLIQGADVRFKIPPLTPVQITQVIHETTGERPNPKDLTGIGGPSLRDLAVAVRQGSTAAACVTRLRAMQDARTVVVDDETPPLEQMHGYGHAQEWGLALAREIRRLQAGEPGITLASLPRGLLVYGPPGVGKSLLAKSIAKSCRIPLVVTSASEWLSSGEGNLRDAIAAARTAVEAARQCRPGLLFIDEIDSITDRARENSKHASWWVNFTNGVLTLIDSAATEPGLVIIGACNHPDLIDPALKRAGRFDHIVRISLPDTSARAGILRTHLGPDLTGADLSGLALLTEGMTGADLARVVRDARRRARDAGRQLSMGDLEYEVLPPDPRKPGEIAGIALHEAGHAVVACAIGFEVSMVTISTIGGSGGQTHAVVDHGTSPSRSQLELEIIGALAGRATDAILGSGPNSGAAGSQRSDLAMATRMVAMMQTSLGLGDSLLYRASPDEAADLLNRDPRLRAQVEEELQRLYKRTEIMVQENARAIRAVAKALVKRRILMGADVREIMAANPARTAAKSSGRRRLS